MTQCLVLADDLTGSTDTGHEFARRGYATRVVLSSDTDAVGDDVVVYNTASRYAPPEEARDRVETILADREPPVVYKKVDSTLRGNVVAEVEAVAEAVDPSLVVVAPAFPANGRRTACGYHLVEGSLVTDSPAGQDPDRPATHDSLPALFARSDYPVEHVGIDAVAKGPDAVADAFAESQSSGGPTIVTCDAIAKEHLESIATGADAVDGQCAFVGSGGLAKYVVLQGDGSAEEPVAADQDERPVVGVSGSVAPETLAQVRRVPDGLRRKLDLEAAVSDPETAGSALADWAAAPIRDRGAVVLLGADDPSDVEQSTAAGASQGLSEEAVRERVGQALAAGADETVRLVGPANLFLTGGATAEAVLGRLGVTGLRMHGEQVAAGIPVSTAIGGAADGASVVTKAGGFGDESAIVKSLVRLGYDNA